MKTKKLFLLIILLLSFGCTDEQQEKTCNVDKPLTDLPWLKAKTDEITSLSQDHPVHITIYQCLYDGGKAGFLEDRGNIAFLYNCEGETLCITGGDAGETCSELNITDKVLIWEINNNNMNDQCKFESPLTDLPWLKKIVDELETGSIAGDKIHTKIYQCTYRDGIGFLLEYCVGCPDAGYSLISCEGEPLCLMWGFAGDPCTEFSVDFENKILIYEINKPK